MRWLAPLFARLRREEDGAGAILFAIALTALIGGAAVAVDMASLFLARRELQGMADAAALAAANHQDTGDAEGAVDAILGAYDARDVLVLAMTPGIYTQNRQVAFDARFTPTTIAPTAARVELERTMPLFFARVFDRDIATVRAHATAQRTDIAAYSLGSKLAQVSGGIPNKLLSALAGTELNLSVMDTQGLVTAHVDLLGFAEALKVRTGANGTYGEVFGQEVALSDAVAALASATKDAAARALLESVAAKLPGGSIRLSDIMDLGPYAQIDYYDTKSKIDIDAYSILRTMLEISNGDHYDVELALDIAGLANTSVRLVGGSGWERSPWLTVTSAKDYTLRTAQSRLYLNTEVGTGSLSLAKLQVPIYVELAEAEAQLTDIVCTGDPATDGVEVAVTPSIGSAAVANVDATQFADLTTPVTLSPAPLVSTALLKVTAHSNVDFGGGSPQDLHFSMDEIRARAVKTVATDDLTQVVADSLKNDVSIDVKALGLGLNLGSVSSLVGNTLSTVAPLIDAILLQVTEAAGVKIGAADVRVDKARCGIPALVA